MDWPGDGTLQIRSKLIDGHPFPNIIKSIKKRVKTGEKLTISIQLTAPSSIGTYSDDVCQFQMVLVSPDDKTKTILDPS